MQLSKKQWRLLARAVGKICWVKAKQIRITKHLLPVMFDGLGVDGEYGAAQGLDPCGLPPRHEIIHALRALVAAANRLDTKHLTDDALMALMEAEDVLDQCDHGVAAA
jgi:hypothetical protein